MKLQYKVTLLVFGILLVIGIVGALIMLHLQRQSAESQFEQSAMTLAGALQDSLEHDMLEANREHIQNATVLIASGSLINEVVIISNDHEVWASGEDAEIGEIRNDEEIVQALVSGETVTRTEKRYGHNELCVIVPVMPSSPTGTRPEMP